MNNIIIIIVLLCMLLMFNIKASESFGAPRPGFKNAVEFCKTVSGKLRSSSVCKKCATGPNITDLKNIFYSLNNINYSKKIFNKEFLSKNKGITKDEMVAIIDRVKTKLITPLQTDLINNFNAVEQDLYGSEIDWWTKQPICNTIINKRFSKQNKNKNKKRRRRRRRRI